MLTSLSEKGTPPKEKVDTNKSELFIGLVGPVGTDLNKVYEYLSLSLQHVGYKAHQVKLSQLISDLEENKGFIPPGTSELSRIEKLMDAGDTFREKMEDGSAVARLAIEKIALIREAETGDSQKPAYGNAYVLNSLKHPAEIDFLKNIYGQSFWVMSVYEPHSDRIKFLLEKEAKTNKPRIPLLKKPKEVEAAHEYAKELLKKDKGFPKKSFGQNVGKAFHLADIFISKQNEGRTGYNLEEQIDRFISLLFGAPFITPTRDEYGSFYAHAAALKSADLSRQVGATLTTQEGELIASGCNEVPSAGGGTYWDGEADPEKKDYRDFKLKVDANAQMKNENVKEILEALKEANWLSDDCKNKDMQQLLNEALYRKEPPAILKETGIANIIEFGRIVHAEMTAITDAARRGIPLKGATLYTTTFPCHVCARHILASGIQRVVYIEPYPKSHAGAQYKCSIRIDDDPEADSNAIQFDAFMGVAPRVFTPLFTKVERKNDEGYAHPEETRMTHPKIRNLQPTYTDGEAKVIADLADRGIIKKGDMGKGEAANAKA